MVYNIFTIIWNLTCVLISLLRLSDPAFHRDCPLDCKVYVGNLGSSGNKTDLEKAFSSYGPLRSVWVARNPPGFAFVEFEDPRDASDAVRGLDGRCTFCFLPEFSYHLLIKLNPIAESPPRFLPSESVN
uniref:Serine and arginine rich splicing factor 3 n=1 Tax=Salarias fasciatus TaxID=181472 RepID=A0A672H3U1_SALFA